MRKSVGQAPTAGEQTQQKPCRTSSDIGAEQEKSYCWTRSDVGWERVKNESSYTFTSRCVPSCYMEGQVFIYFYYFQLCTAAFKAYCAIWVRCSNFRHQASTRVSPCESTQRQKVELWVKNAW
jgi:hypothetical protein